MTTAYCIRKHQPVQCGIDFAELLHTTLKGLKIAHDMRACIQFLWSTELTIKGWGAPPGFEKELCSMINEVTNHASTPFPNVQGVADVI